MARNPKPQQKPAAPTTQPVQTAATTAKPDAQALTPGAQTNTAADQAKKTESTLGDGDAMGAGSNSSQDSTAPAASAPSVVKKAKGHVLRVTGPAKGRWRAGRKFGSEPVDIAVDELTEEDLAKLEGDPELTVALVPVA